MNGIYIFSYIIYKFILRKFGVYIEILSRYSIGKPREKAEYDNIQRKSWNKPTVYLNMGLFYNILLLENMIPEQRECWRKNSESQTYIITTSTLVIYRFYMYNAIFSFVKFLKEFNCFIIFIFI